VIVLAVGTALADCGAAVVADGAVAGVSCAPALGDAEAIHDHVAAALGQAGLAFDDIARIAVTVGPGSFTGVRVGIAAAKGFSLALGVPAVGVSTLDVIAYERPRPLLAVLDARHGAVFAGRYGDCEQAGKCTAEAASSWAGACGAAVVGDAGGVAAVGRGTVVGTQDFVAMAALGAGDPAGRAPRAVYLAQADARPPLHKSLARA